MNRNYCIANLSAGYLFPEIARRRREFAAAHPEAQIISLGVGNTTEPIPPHICAGLVEGAQKLGTAEGYSGYQDEGLLELREKISAVYYGGQFSADEIFISDGAKCDIGRLQMLFGAGVSVAVQDPTYPVYVDGSVLMGAAGCSIQRVSSSGSGSGYDKIVYLPCSADNNFFPELAWLPSKGLIYFCSPNNPTGIVLSRLQLSTIVETALRKNSLIIFDAAYSDYIRDPTLPKSIYEIEGARGCAIEINSFSKSAGFTGVRLGWTVVPLKLKYSSGGSLNADWGRVSSTIFNGASNIAQAGGIAALDDEGQKEIRDLVDFYLGNAQFIKNTLQGLGISCVGGDNAPYIWARFPGRDSWDVFSEILEKCHVVVTPGGGFGTAGAEYIRFSAFGHRADVEEACQRLKKL